MISATQILEGNRLALSRLLTHIENNSTAGRAVLAELYPQAGSAYCIGVTGASGTGKSSLVNQLALHYRRSDSGGPFRVAIIAVDPSSPFTGGAILGDRVRMRDLSGDPGVFIRSMASRGSLGGLAAATSGFVQALDSAGFEIILIETVGAGQAEVDIARLAHTTLVIEAPGLGDDIQAIKAGILEIADVLVINKSDRPGVENTERALRSMLQLGHPSAHVFQNHTLEPGHRSTEMEAASSSAGMQSHLWLPPIIRTVAIEAQGVAELASAIQQHRQHLHSSGEWSRRELSRVRLELDLLVREALVSRWLARTSPERYQQLLERILKRELSPLQAADQLVDAR
jgi:LAO/AO transport system kinase